MPLKAFEDFAPEPLAFPVGGKVYTVPEIGWADGVRITAIIDGDEKADAAEQNRLLMGPVFDEMVADKVPAAALSRALLACLTDFRTGDRELAARVWESGLSPEALAPKGAAQDLTPSPVTEAASTTPSQGSTSGTTTSPRKSSPRKAKASQSPKSSSSGD